MSTDPTGAVDGESLALTRPAVLEVIAYLVTATRTQVDEAAEYGPMRLLTAAKRVAELLPEAVADGEGPAVGGLLRELRLVEPTATPTRDQEEYVAHLDRLCEMVAGALLEAHGVEDGGAP
jgi:acyl-CoA reductase-like NAD-dependent aldehyde dehydrogenase